MWAVAQHTGAQERDEAGLLRTRAGRAYAAWEDVLCMVFGVDWRSLRDGCHNISDWMKHVTHFTNTVGSRWHLPCLPEQSHGVHSVWEAGSASDYTLKNIPKLEAHPCDTIFDEGDHRIFVLVDTKPYLNY